MLNGIYQLKDGENFQFSPENVKAEKGRGATAPSNLGPGRKGQPCLTIQPGKSLILVDTARTGIIQHVWFTDAADLSKGRDECEKVRLQVFYAGAKTPAIDVPLRYLFGDFSNLTEERYNIYSLPVALDNRGHNLYLPIPFAGGIKMVVVNGRGEPFKNLFYQVDGIWLDELPEGTALLAARFRDSWPNKETEDHVLFDAAGRGHYIGGFTYIQGWGRFWHGEGEVKMFVDGDKDLPTICGTGTEDYYGSAWCYNTAFNSPFLGLPFWKQQAQQAVAYRWHLPDPVNFHKQIKVTIQNIGWQRGLAETHNDTLSMQFAYLQAAEVKPARKAKK
jgi:hypothetical protein